MLLLNLQGSKIVNSIGISILIEMLEKMLEIEGKLAFCCLTPTIQKTFHIMGLTQYARIYPDEAAALAGLGDGGSPPQIDMAGTSAPPCPPDPATRRLHELGRSLGGRRRALLRERCSSCGAAPSAPPAPHSTSSARRPTSARARRRAAELLREVVVGEGPFPASSSRGGGAPGRGATGSPPPLAGGLLVARPTRAELEGRRRRSRRSRSPCCSPPRCAPSARKQLKQQDFEAKYRGVELEAVYEVGLAIASTLDLEELSEEILLRAVSLLDARRGAFYLLDGDAYRLDRTFGGDARDRFAADDPALEPFLAGKGRGRRSCCPVPAT